MVQYYTTIDNRLTETPSLQEGGWINVTPPFRPSELAELADTLEIPQDFLTDSLDMDERSRYERDHGINLILVNAPILTERSQDNEAIYITSPIGIVFSKEFVLTISGSPQPVLQYFIDGRVKHVNTDNHTKFILQIFEQIVYRYLACLKKLNVKRHLIETELYNSSRSSDLKQLLRIEKSLVYFVNSLSSNELLKLKMKRTDFLRIGVDEDLTDLFEDVIIDNGQALEMSNVHTNILNSTMEAYAAIISNNLNVIIQRLTLVTIILMLPTLVASYYGMNVEGLPYSDSKYAFYYIIVFSIIISSGLAWFFRRKNMF